MKQRGCFFSFDTGGRLGRYTWVCCGMVAAFFLISFFYGVMNASYVARSRSCVARGPSQSYPLNRRPRTSPVAALLSPVLQREQGAADQLQHHGSVGIKRKNSPEGEQIAGAPWCTGGVTLAHAAGDLKRGCLRDLAWFGNRREVPFMVWSSCYAVGVQRRCYCRCATWLSVHMAHRCSSRDLT